MLLKVFSPYEIVFEKEIEKVNFEGVDGFFTFLPKHIDFVSVLAPSIVTYFEKNNKKSYLACDSGFVLKEGGNVLLSVHNVIEGTDLKELQTAIKTTFKAQEEERKELSAVMARLEAGLSRGFVRLKEETSHAV